MVYEKSFETDAGRVVHVSSDRVRYYPKDMVEELAVAHDESVEKVLKHLEKMQ